jgi:hypothetical protein
MIVAQWDHSPLRPLRLCGEYSARAIAPRRIGML